MFQAGSTDRSRRGCFSSRGSGCGLLAAILVLGTASAQKPRDPLSGKQADEVRELGDHPVERVKLFLKFVNERVAAIHDLTPHSTENSRPAELRARYEEFTRLADELAENVDTYDSDGADLRKALRLVAENSMKWPEVLKAPTPDETYDFPRRTALDAAEAVREQAQKLLQSEENYFATHKDQAGKNGKAPTPES